MSKVTIPNIVSSSGFTSVSDVNDRLSIIQEAIDDMLSRSGSLPNQMAVSLDMNGNSIINIGVENLDVAELRQRSTHIGVQAISTITGLQDALNSKQATLSSGTNIKTINGLSVLGSGNLEVAGGGGDGASLSDNQPQPLGSPSAGVATTASRSDHVHTMPSAGDVGADPSGTASSAVTTHEGAADPHSQYVQKVTGKGLSTEDYTTAEKSKLTGVEAGAQVNVATNLSQGTRTDTAVNVTSSTGTNATLQAATDTLAGVMVAADKTKLDGVATGATANSTDAALRDRTTHTGSQAISTVTDLQSSLDGKAATAHTHPLTDLQQSAATNGQVATWNGTAWVPQTPSAGGGLPAGADQHDILVQGATDPEWASTVRPVGVQHPEHDNGNLGATPTLNVANGTAQKGVINASPTVTLTAPVHASAYMRIHLTVDATGGYSITWPAGLQWITGTAPTFDMTASAENFVVLIYANGGWIGDGGSL